MHQHPVLCLRHLVHQRARFASLHHSQEREWEVDVDGGHEEVWRERDDDVLGQKNQSPERGLGVGGGEGLKGGADGLEVLELRVR